MKTKILKIGAISITILISIFFLWRFFSQHLYKTKAAQTRVTLSFTNQSLEFNQNETKTIPFTLTAADSAKISAINLYLKFNLQNKDLIEYKSFSTTPINYFDEVVKQEIINSSSYGGSKILHLVLVSKKRDDQLLSSLLFNLNFSAKKRAGSTSISLHASTGNIQNQVVGSTSGYIFDLRVNNDTTNITVNNQGNCSSVSALGSSDCGQNASCQNNDFCVCNSGFYNCDGNWENGCESSQTCSSPTNTPTPTPTETPAPTPTTPPGNTTLNLKIKFQGITQKPPDQYNSLAVKVTAVSSSGSKTVASGNFSARDIDANKKGIWEGTVSFNLAAGSYRLLVKGPKHIQKKICHSNPTEPPGGHGTYTCGDTAQINISNGVNNLDLSGIYLLVGDLPNQDGVVNSYDLALVRNNLGKTDAEALRLADLNLDGRVNTQDYSLIMAALAIRADEE